MVGAKKLEVLNSVTMSVLFLKNSLGKSPICYSELYNLAVPHSSKLYQKLHDFREKNAAYKNMCFHFLYSFV